MFWGIQGLVNIPHFWFDVAHPHQPLKLIIPYPLALKNYPHDRAVPSCGNLILGKCFLNNK